MNVRLGRIKAFDLSAITNECNRWKSNGFQADYDILDRDRGAAALFLENCFRQDDSFIGIDIFKLQFKKLIGTRSAWVLQLFDLETRHGPACPKGWVSARTLSGGLTNAISDAKFGFVSVMDRELAIQSVS